MLTSHCICAEQGLTLTLGPTHFDLGPKIDWLLINDIQLALHKQQRSVTQINYVKIRKTRLNLLNTSSLATDFVYCYYLVFYFTVFNTINIYFI